MNTTYHPGDVIATKEDNAPHLAYSGKVISWWAMIIGLIFLANPMPLLFDILPDVIGYLLILYALRHAVGEVDVFRDFKKPTSRLLLLSAVKVISFFIMLSIWGNDPAERSIIAVFTLAFSILEFIFLRPWIQELFEAFSWYGRKFDCSAALSGEGKSFRLSPEKLEKLTLIFFLVRSVLSCLPEMTMVPISDGVSRGFDWYSMYPLCAFAGVVIILIFGIIWACYMVSYIRRISHDREAEYRVAACITQGSRAERENAYRLIHLACGLMIAAVVFQFDIVLDGINFVPDIISALLFFAAGLCLYRLMHTGRAVWIMALIYGVSSIAYEVFSARFFTQFSQKELAARTEKAMNAYLPVIITALLSTALLITACVLLFFALRRIIHSYTGITAGGLTEAYIEEQVRHAPPAEAEELRRSYTVIANKTKSHVTILLVLHLLLGCLPILLTLLSDLLFFFLPAFSPDPTTISEIVITTAYDILQIAVWIFNFVWLGISWYISNRIQREAELNLIEE